MKALLFVLALLSADASSLEPGDGQWLPIVIRLGENLPFPALGAGFVESPVTKTYLPVSKPQYRMMRIRCNMTVGASTGDLVVQCSDSTNFASTTVLAGIRNPVIGMNIGDWFTGGGVWDGVTSKDPPGECYGGAYIRVGMQGGNGVEGPVIGHVDIELR